MFVYLITNAITDKYYIGQHKGNNLRQYLQKKFYDAAKGRGGSSHLYSSMRKHPKDAWSICALRSDIQTKEELNKLEKLFILSLDSRNPEVGYNICRGGEGFTGPHSEESKQKTSRSLKAKGHKRTPEAIAASIRVRRQIHKQSGIWPGAQLKDMTGTTVNGVSVLKRLESTKDGDAVWSCLCECGKPFSALGGSLRSGHTKSCGCLKTKQDQKNLMLGKNLKDITGTVINGIEVLSRADNIKGKNGKCRTAWSCRCRCGNIFVVSGYYIRSGHTKSCGCLRKILLSERKNKRLAASHATS